MKLHPSFIAAVLVAFAACAHAAAPDLDATVTYQTRQVTSGGVTRTETWQERLIRRGDTVWTERVLPARAAASHAQESATEHVGHKHFDFDSAARLVQRGADGQLRLRYVDRQHRVVVSVPKAEFGAVGFDGRWDTAAHIVAPAVVERMGSAGGGAKTGWRSGNTAGWQHRVQWSESLQVALRVESQRDDGSTRRVVSIVPTRAVAANALPWNALAGFGEKDYDDFMD